MKKLIILAHPSEYGFSSKAAKAYAEAARQAGHQVEFIDLYQEPHQEFLSFKHVKDVAATPLRDKYHGLIKWSDEISLFFPMWWMEAPAILKNFIDNNFSNGFAFNYTEKGPVGLLKGRTARILITCDGPSWTYKLVGTPIKIIWSIMIMRFCGLRVTTFKIFDIMRKRSEENKKILLDQVKRLAKN